jgi:hypothetical protein
MNTFLKSHDIENWHITSLALILTAFAILNLIKGDFYIFVLLILTAHYTDIINHRYREQYDLEGGMYYERLSDWIRLLSVLLFFTRIYRRKITPLILILVLVLLLLCNVNFTIRSAIDIREGAVLEQSIVLWTKLCKKIPTKKLKEIYHYTHYFNETNIYLSLVAIMIYIHVK